LRQTPVTEEDTTATTHKRIVSRFTLASAVPLTTGHFSGSAVKALTAEDGFRQIEIASN